MIKVVEKLGLILKYLAPSLLALCVVIIDIFVSSGINHSYYANNDTCGPTPSPFATLVLACLGLAMSSYGVISAFKEHRRWLGTFAIVLTLLVACGGLVAIVFLDFALCIKSFL